MAPSSKKKKSKVSIKEKDENTEFEDLLIEIGVEFKEIENGIQLSNDVVTIQEKLSKAFKIHIDQDLLVQEAELFFKKEFENDDKLNAYLSPVLLCKFHSTNTSAMNDSFVRVLLCVPQIQKPLINTMLEKLMQLDNKQNHGTSMLLLKQLCWLPSLVDAELLAEQYSKLMVQVSTELASCMLSYLPCIFPEPCPLSLKNSLVDMLETHMSTALIDCLDSIDLPPDSLDKLIETMKTALSTQYLPMCLIFLLNCSSDIASVIEETRERVTLESFKGGEECWMLLIDKLKVLLLTNKSTSVAWIQNIERCNNVGVVDWVVMLLLHTENTHDLRLKVEKLATHVAPRLNTTFIASFFQSSPKIFESLFTGLTRFAYMWMKKNQQLSECIYINAFNNLSCYFKQEIVAELVGQVCGGCHCDQALDTLLQLTLHHTSSVIPYGSFLNAMLDSVDRLNVQQVKKLYQILSILTFNTTSKNSAKQDGFFILIKKQLSSGVLKYQQLGIVGGLMSLKSLSLQTDDAKKSLKQSIEIIGMLEESATKKTSLLAFYYEELAALSKSFSRDLQEWLLNKVMEDFQNNYVLDVPGEAGQSSSKTDTSVQHCLDDEAEIAVNLVYNEHSPVCCSAVCLNSCFRLLHSLHNCCHDNIADIEALLGCGVKTEATGSDKQALITSTLLKINFFRELLNAFSREADTRVVSRLQDVVELQEAALQLISEYPGYKPLGLTRDSVMGGDQVFVMNETKKKKRKKTTKSKGSKQKKVAEEEEDEDEDNDDDENDSSRLVLEKKDIKIAVLLRDLDVCVVRMLAYCSLDTAEEMHKVSIRGLHLLLQQLNSTVASPDKEDLTDLMGHLCRLAKQVAKVLHESSCDDVDGMEDWKVASDCLILIINTISLFIIKEGKEKAAQDMKLKGDPYDFFNKLAIDLFALQSSTSSLSIQMAVDMVTLLNHLDSPQTVPDTCDMAMSCLRHSWTDENDKVTKDSIPKLLALAGVKSMNELIEEMRVDLQDTSLPTLNRTTWAIFYKGLLQQVVKLTKDITPQTPSLESLDMWNKLVAYFHDLILLLKKQHNNANLGSALKFGQQFISEFLKHCMPLIDQLLTSHKQQVQAILKSLQPATRVLQHLCTHTKIEKQTALTQRVPAMKKVLEAFVQRVKQTLRLNCCLNAFWLGNLKHRNLKGDEILSQAPTKMADDEEEEEDEEEDDDQNKENEEVNKSKERNDKSDKSDDESALGQDEDSGDVDYLFKESSDSENNEEQNKQETGRPSVDNTVMSLAF